MVWYFHLFKNFPQFVVIHTVKDFSIVNEAEVDIFLAVLIAACASSSLALHVMYSAYKLNKQGDNIQP